MRCKIPQSTGWREFGPLATAIVSGRAFGPGKICGVCLSAKNNYCWLLLVLVFMSAYKLGHVVEWQRPNGEPIDR